MRHSLIVKVIENKPLPKKQQINLPIPRNDNGELTLADDSREGGWYITALLPKKYHNWGVESIEIELDGETLDTKLEVLESNLGKSLLFKYADGSEGRITLTNIK